MAYYLKSWWNPSLQFFHSRLILRYLHVIYNNLEIFAFKWYGILISQLPCHSFHSSIRSDILTCGTHYLTPQLKEKGSQKWQVTAGWDQILCLVLISSVPKDATKFLKKFSCTLLLPFLELAVNLWQAGYKGCWTHHSWCSII